ncbi:unnamed protein product [Symbiodinium microadriaticum]|nr:unnamed protein product [Symbiodinium microadriaticum]
MGATGVERWQCVCKVPLSIRTAPRGKGEIVAVIGPGDLVAFTPFPKRPVTLSDLSAHSFLRCRKLEAAEASRSESEQGWISCNSEDGGVHFIPFTGLGDGQATWSWKSWFQRSSSQNPWLNQLARLKLPATEGLEEDVGSRLLLDARVRGKFTGIFVCDALAGFGMAVRPCMDRVAQRWIRENFSVDVASVSSLELAALLEKRTVEDRHRLVLLLVQEPRAWVARARLSGFPGASLAREAEAGKLEFAAGKGTCLEHWLQQPVECSGNLHSRGLMSLWAWFTQDLARAAIASRHVVLCRVEDLLFDSAAVAVALRRLLIKQQPADAPVHPPAHDMWWHQAIECYRQCGSFTCEQGDAIDAPVAGLRGALGYAEQDWRTWSSTAVTQLDEARINFSPTTSSDQVVAHTLRLDPSDSRKYTLERLCSKYTSLSRFDAEQYFWSHCWTTEDVSSQTRPFEFDGVWNYSSGCCTIKAGEIRWQSGLQTYIQATSDVAFNMELDGEMFQGKLADGDRLIFSDGDVWCREVTEGGSATARSLEAAGRPGEADCASVSEVQLPVPEDELEPVTIEPESLGNRLTSETAVLDAVAGIFGEAVARSDVNVARRCLQQVELLGGQSAVQHVLAHPASADAFGHLPLVGSAADDSQTIVKLLLEARADIDDLAASRSKVALAARFNASDKPAKDPVDVCFQHGDRGANANLSQNGLNAGYVTDPDPHRVFEPAQDADPRSALGLLQAECRACGLQADGTETELVERLARLLVQRSPAVKNDDSSQQQSRLLEGVRIVEACSLPAGPFSAASLAACGAQVLKLELDPLPGGKLSEAELSKQCSGAASSWWSSVPQPLALDLELPMARQVLEQTLAECDCFIHSFRVNSAERLGLGKARLAESPQLLIVSLSGLQSLMGQPSLFAFQGFVEMEDGQPPSSQSISATVAASTIAQRIESIRAGDRSGRYVRVSVTGPGRVDEAFS